MTTAEKYRQFEKSPIISIAKYIFNDLKNSSTNVILENVIIDIKTGKTPSKQQKKFYEDDFFDWFKPDEVGSEKYLFSAKEKISKYAFETKQATIFEPNTILINAIGDIGRVSILKNRASSNQQITGIRLDDKINIDYAYYYFVSFREYFYSDFSKTTLPLINQKKINLIPFHYPNIELQESIVHGLEILERIKSIDDLYLINKLKWNEKYKEECKKFFIIQFRAKSIVYEFTDQLSLVKQLRQAFLAEAMQGKLVTQSKLPEKSGQVVKDQETGQQLLAGIKAEKAQLIKDKIIKQGKLQEAEVQENLIFEIPENWTWCNLDDICSNITDGTHQTPAYKKSGRMFLSAQNVKPFKFMPDKHKFVSEEDYQVYIKNRKPEMGDLLIGRVGAGIGETAVIDQELDFCIYVSVALVQPFKKSVNSDYLAYIFNSPYGIRYAKGNISSKGGSAGNFNLGRIRSFQIPLPPLLIQNQIVAKLNELMKTCDDLENCIKQSQLQNEQLLQQVLKEALEVKEVTIDTVSAQPKIVKLNPTALNLDKLVAEPFEKYVAKPTNNIQNGDLEMALMIACMKNKLGVTYGDVGLQKNVYNTNNLYPIFSKQYQFVNSNFGTYSYELKEDLKKNPYLITQKVAGNKEVYTINPKYNSQILDKLTASENKGFVQAINRMLSIYEHPFINKETDKIELYNTVLKLSLDKNTEDIEIIYQGMKDWKINQAKYKTKAEKFSKNNSKRMLELLVSNGFKTQIDN